MKNISIATLALSLAITLVAPSVVLAQTPHATHAGNSADYTDGEVRTIYKDEGKVTIKHGEIKNLNMSAMTMVFMVSDKSMLSKIKTGDKIRFKAVSKSGELMITEIQGVK